MANFSLREPKYGDIIRVKIKDDIYHYGIYENDNSVIQFGSAKDAFKTDSSDVCVETTTIKDFLNGKFLEVREYSFIEKLKFQQQIASVCHLFNHNGLVLDIDGSCLPCNRMYSHPIGKFRVDFFDKKRMLCLHFHLR